VNKSFTQVSKQETAAIILAGGTARRLADKRPPGGKAECIIGGQSLLSIVSGALVPVTRLILVVGGDQPKVSSQELVPIRHIPDHQPGSGPLAAVRDGLRWIWHEHSKSLPQFVILSACDLPSIKPSLVSEMVDRFPQDELSTRWVIPEVGKRLQYLFSVCRPTILQPLDSFFAAGGRDFRSFVQYLQEHESTSIHVISDAIWRTIDPNAHAGSDIDTPADLALYSGDASH
jgi:molybdopterin-guanine dinucleotide biosynthesis protein A|tara:strand:- start:342 stop:1034 length:693 start_codon:yes stop_codon:yes gene_type:complete